MVASIVQPSAEEVRKRQLASQLFGGGGTLSGPARAPRQKLRGETPGKIDSRPPRRSVGRNEVKNEDASTDLLLDLQVRNLLQSKCTLCIIIHVNKCG